MKDQLYFFDLASGAQVRLTSLLSSLQNQVNAVEHVCHETRGHITTASRRRELRWVISFRKKMGYHVHAWGHRIILMY